MWRNVWELEMVPLLQHTLVILSQFILLLRLLTWQIFFCSSLLFVIGSFVSQTFLMPGLYIRSVFLWLHASEWKWIIYEPSEHASISPSFSFFLSLSLSPVLFFSWHDPIMCASKENDIQPSWKWICAFCQSKPCVCVCLCQCADRNRHPPTGH